MASTDTTENIRFLDFPAEVRDYVYVLVVCDFPQVKSTWDEAGKFATVPTDLAVMDHKIETAILRVNRQVYSEAKSVMLKRNQFIRLVAPEHLILAPLVSKQVPIVLINSPFLNKFEGFIMTHTIKDKEGPSHSGKDWDMMILQRDLDLFCQGLQRAEIGVPRFCSRTEHRITIHDPFKKTSSPDFMNFKNQERLLKPYRDHLRGFVSVRVIGKVVSKKLAKAVESEVKEEPIPDPQELLQDIIRQKDLGNKYFSEKSSTMASESWCKALMQIHRITNSALWSKVKAKGGTDFANALTKLVWQLNSNRAANTIVAMRDNVNNPDLVASYVGAAEHAINCAKGAAEQLGTTWKPSPEQDAKLLYRYAVVQRLSNSSLQIAELSIRAARQKSPNDKAIELEEEEIARWRARGY